MTASVSSAASAESGVWLSRERVLGRFEDAWRAGPPPELGAFLPGDRPDPELLRELVHTDLEYRVQRGFGARVESYLQEYPSLAGDPRAVAELAVAEFQARARAGQPVTVDEFRERFPQLGDELSARLSSDTTEENDPERTKRSERTPTVVPGNEPPIGRVGKYDLYAEIGSGAFGRVFRGRDPELDRPVAVKVAKPGHFDSDGTAERFIREARAAAQLRHPNLLAVYDAGRTPEGGWFIASALLPGGTLQAQIKSRKVIPPEQAARWVAEAADGLQFAHENGTVHRDIKPANLMLDDRGRVQVVDFGLARRLGADPTLTLDGQVLGTPVYMAPEQAAGKINAVDARSDVYALGATLYHLVTGRTPFRGTPSSVIHAVLHTDPEPPRRANRAVPRDLDRIIQKAMAKEPGARYATAGALAADLRRFLSGEPVKARPLDPARRLARWAARNPVVAVLTFALFAVTAAGAGLFGWKYFEASDNAARAENRNRAAIATHVAGERQADEGRRLLAELLKAGVIDGLEPVTLQHLSHALLDEIATHFERTLAERPVGRDKAEAARFYAALALIYRIQGRPDRAVAALTEGRELRVPGSPEHADDQFALATARFNERNFDEARAAFAEIRTWAAEQNPVTVPVRVLALRAAVGESQCATNTKAPRAAADALTKAEEHATALEADPALPPAARYAVAEYRHQRGVAALDSKGGPAGAADDLRRAADGFARLSAEYPASADLLNRAGIAHQRLADALRLAGADPLPALDRAAEFLNKVIAVWESKLAEAPNDPGVRSSLASSYGTLASVQASAGRLDDAVRCNRRSVELLLALHKEHGVHRHLHDARSALRNMTRALTDAGRFDDAEATIRTRAALAATDGGELWQARLSAVRLQTAMEAAGRPIPPSLVELVADLNRRLLGGPPPEPE